ncbi:OLC1v1036779C1 [Oldenlandia corymbosa var. corymbosa]|uniref:OLC1v1036779C1 n=1 Tax=Oldenlandia corymbosa var. corymbosa TaxID=529605 RepID=A0AAV1CYU9_OLDCO|nr:OLC1v1036779C1 [Oldenlandia corymbosa var. corymbosa]
MPISSDLNNPRNSITKISKYNKFVNIPNSMAVLDELLSIAVEMAKETAKEYGTSQIRGKVIVAPRSNNEMAISKLKNEFPELLSMKESLIKYVFEPNKKILLLEKG